MNEFLLGQEVKFYVEPKRTGGKWEEGHYSTGVVVSVGFANAQFYLLIRSGNYLYQLKHYAVTINSS